MPVNVVFQRINPKRKGLELLCRLFLAPPQRFQRAVFLSSSEGVPPMTLGTLRSDDGDGNENVIKAIVLISKTITFHAHPTLFCTFVVFARLRSENA